MRCQLFSSKGENAPFGFKDIFRQRQSRIFPPTPNGARKLFTKNTFFAFKVHLNIANEFVLWFPNVPIQ